MHEERYRAVYQRLHDTHQTHLLSYYDTLGETEQAGLLEELEAIDLEFMNTLYKKAQAETSGPVKSHFTRIEPLPCLDTTKLSIEEKVSLSRRGLDAIRQGELAALTMAGGQGTRLGHNGPKGTYDIGLPGHESLFELQSKSLQHVSEQAGCTVDWYIMTSTINHEDTIRFFELHHYFGYPRQQVHFFPQMMIPAMTADGKLQLSEPGHVLCSPNGNGGLFVSLLQSGYLEAMKQQGVKYLFVCGIDNCLVKMADPMFLGAMLSDTQHPQVSAKSYIKRNAEEKAGIFCRRDGCPGVLEYTEIPETYAQMQHTNGEWVYGDANVLNYIFELSVVEQLARFGAEYHVAVKKLTYLDPAAGGFVTAPAGYKFELFLFDTFLALKELQVVRIERTEEFAPVKNPTGVDSAESAREMYLNYGKTQPRKWEEQI